MSPTVAMSPMHSLGRYLLNLADGLSGAVIGFAFYGSWAVWANFDSQAPSSLAIALRSGLLQGSMSFAVTLGGTTLMKALFAGTGAIWWRFSRAVLGTLLSIYAVIISAHLLNHTPHILLTLAPGLPITVVFCLSFCLGLARYGSPQAPPLLPTRDHEMNVLKHILADTRATLMDLLSLCESSQVDSDFFRSSVGPHARHVLDHYDSLFTAIHAPGTTPTVDYDSRARDPRTEQDRAFASQRIRRSVLALEQLGEHGFGYPLQVVCSTSPDREPDAVPSSLGRELQFLQSHCIHHLAVIAARAEREGIELRADFGKAPATIAQERSLTAATDAS